MKILYHHRIRSRDGQNVHMEELIKALRKLNHEVLIVGPAALEHAEFGANAGLVDILKRWLSGFIYEILEFGYSVPAALRLSQAIKRFRPDVIYERYNLFFPAGVWIAKRKTIPLLLEINAPLADEREKYSGLKLRKLARWSEQWTWRNAAHVLPVTQVLARSVLKAGVDQGRLTVIHNGIAESWLTSQTDANAAKRTLGLEDKLVLGFTGFMRTWHGLDRVLPLLQGDQQPRHLLLVGDGPAREDLERQASNLGIKDKITFTGIVNRNHIAAYVAAFDIALQPHVVEYASPLKLFEYMALGKAIVAPAMDNISEILRHETHALLFDSGDAAAFTRSVEILCNNSVLREKLGRHAQTRIRELELTWEHNARRVQNIFEDLLSGI